MSCSASTLPLFSMVKKFKLVLINFKEEEERHANRLHLKDEQVIYSTLGNKTIKEATNLENGGNFDKAPPLKIES